jgi:hypothetical protein
LKVNTAKTNVVIFSKSRQSENIDFIYNNERLTVVDEFQYLGHITKKKGGWGVVITTHHLQRSISQI